jgi:hypothetical protein
VRQEKNMPTDVRDLQEVKNEDLDRHEQPKLPEVEIEIDESTGKPPKAPEVDHYDQSKLPEVEIGDGNPSKVQEVEGTARQIEQPALEPIDRTANLLLLENELTKEGVATPMDQERPAR